MFRTNEEELQYINKKIVMINLLATPGAILLGLGLYGLFGAQGNAFIDILNNQNVVYGCLVVGAVIMLWEFVAVIRLLIRKSEITKNKNQ